MGSSDQGTRFVKELNAFLDFLKNVWGLLAGVSVFFPLSNVLANVVPLKSIAEDGGFAILAPALVTTLATITSLFLILWTFGNREEFRVHASQRRPIQRRAMISFGVGVLVLLAYVVLYVVKQRAYGIWGWESEDPRHLIVEVPLLIAYVAGFTLVTRAFLLLGMMEYFAVELRNG